MRSHRTSSSAPPVRGCTAVWLAAVLLVGCSAPADETEHVDLTPWLSVPCPWFRTCGGQCGGCDDGDPCTVDECVDAVICTHRPAPECACDAGCDGFEPAFSLARGDGGLLAPLGPTDIATSDDGRVVFLAGEIPGGTGATCLVDFEGQLRPAGSASGDWVSVAAGADAVHAMAVGAGGIALLEVAEGSGLRVTDSLDEPAARVVSGPGHYVVVTALGVRVFERSRTLNEVARVALGVSGRDAAVADDGRILLVDGDRLTGWRLDGSAAGSVSGLGFGGANAVVTRGDRAWVAGYCDHGIGIVGLTPEGLERVGVVGGAPVGACEPLGLDRRGGGTDLEYPTDLALLPDGTLAVALKSRGFQVLFYRPTETGLEPLGFTADQPPFDDYSDEAFHLHPPDLPNPFDVEPENYRLTTTLSAAGQTVFAASRYQNAVARIPVSEVGPGAPDFLQRGQGGVGSIPGAYNLALSPDDRHVYVAPRVHGSVGAFARDGAGLTELPQALVPHDAELDAGGVTNVAVSPDGSQVLAVDTTPPSLYVHQRDAGSGALSFERALAVPACDGGLPLPVDVVIAPDGRHVYVADFQDVGPSCMSVWPRAAEGSIGSPMRYDDDVLAGIESFAITADSRDVYAACFHANSVAHYRWAGDTLGAGTHQIRDDLAGAEFVVLSPDESRVFVSSPVFHKLLAFARDAGTGELSHIQTLGWPDEPIHGAAGLAVAPSGETLYLASRLDSNLTRWSIATDGRLTRTGLIEGVPGLQWVNGVAVTSDGAWLVTSAVASSSVSTFSTGAMAR